MVKVEKRALDDTGALSKMAEPTGLEPARFAAFVPFSPNFLAIYSHQSRLLPICGDFVGTQGAIEGDLGRYRRTGKTFSDSANGCKFALKVKKRA